jgi:hypothetical protein
MQSLYCYRLHTITFQKNDDTNWKFVMQSPEQKSENKLGKTNVKFIVWFLLFLFFEGWKSGRKQLQWCSVLGNRNCLKGFGSGAT